MNARRVLITGGSKGIGWAMAERFRDAGFQVAATYRSGGVPDGVFGVQCDITSQPSVEAAFSEVETNLGSVEVLVANAGVTDDALLMRMSDESWQQVIDTNLTGTFRVVRRASQPMMRARFGRIILISSVVGLLGNPGQVNYAASKAALVGMARSITRELGGRGVTCNVIAPGFIDTDMTKALSREAVQGYEQRIPAGRLGSVDDVADAALFLGSDNSSYISGAVIPVDGGLGMGH